MPLHFFVNFTTSAIFISFIQIDPGFLYFSNVPIFIAGLHSFDFLGLGYRVDWPVSIVLTSGALRIYSDIFSFLIKLKLAIFSLTDVWRSLKV